MQNKGFVRVFAILLTLVCVFYLSFSFVTRHYTNKAKEFAKGDVKVEQDYLETSSGRELDIPPTYISFVFNPSGSKNT